ncbi:MAG: cell division protein FtsW [Atopobiaceae bacterium]|nr:cell division protein FtsW [Atopobiaceae bacterium]
MARGGRKQNGVQGTAKSITAEAGRFSAAVQDMLATPARFMGPRMALIVSVGILAVFGLLMVYSASSISSMASTGTSTYYLFRQLVFVVVGVFIAYVISRFDYHLFGPLVLGVGWTVVVMGLLLTIVMGRLSHGATRWLEIGGFSLQPSEFAKPLIILVMSFIAYRFLDEIDVDFTPALLFFLAGVVLPVGLIFIQPDKGTTIIVCGALLVMLYLAGFPLQFIGWFVAGASIILLVMILRDDYSRQRVITMLFPESDPFGAGYQIIQGYYAFGNGGLFGVGIGLSRQKYSYLPEAHNDFIFAIIGEELGLLGTVFVCLLFVLFVWAAIQIAQYSNDLWGKLIAAGCGSLIAVQFLVNVCGVTGMVPLTGKPLPFLSYGGSSVLSCFILVGLILSVSNHSDLPETVHDVQRAQLGEAPSRTRKEAFVLMDGGAAPSRPRRVDLGPSASDRLRGARSGSSRGSSSRGKRRR